MTGPHTPGTEKTTTFAYTGTTFKGRAVYLEVPVDLPAIEVGTIVHQFMDLLIRAMKDYTP